jgi:hypothetical protein
MPGNHHFPVEDEDVLRIRCTVFAKCPLDKKTAHIDLDSVAHAGNPLKLLRVGPWADIDARSYTR